MPVIPKEKALKAAWVTAQTGYEDPDSVMELWIGGRMLGAFARALNRGGTRGTALRPVKGSKAEAIIPALVQVARLRKTPVYFKWELNQYTPALLGIFCINTDGSVDYGRPDTVELDQESEAPLIDVFRQLAKEAKESIAESPCLPIV